MEEDSDTHFYIEPDDYYEYNSHNNKGSYNNIFDISDNELSQAEPAASSQPS
ncbi:8325_t:CDS:1, partial [Dentiscutata erythropus]